MLERAKVIHILFVQKAVNTALVTEASVQVDSRASILPARPNLCQLNQ